MKSFCNVCGLIATQHWKYVDPAPEFTISPVVHFCCDDCKRKFDLHLEKSKAQDKFDKFKEYYKCKT